MKDSRTRALLGSALLALCVVGGGDVVSAQFQMPDAREMSGIPRPVDDLPAGSISVRLIRGDLSNNITNHPIELRVGNEVRTASTDEAGRAQFDKVPAGALVKALSVVDGERLESQEFPAPPQGGIRLMLVATDKEKAARAAAEASQPAVSGQVTLGGQSRIVIEPGDEIVELYYLLTIVNSARSPVEPPSAFMFDMPTGAIGTTILQGSTPRASTSGARIRVLGPFPPGDTIVQVAATLPVRSGSLEFTQRFPAALPQLTIIAQKVGNLRLTSPQIAQQQEMASNGEAYISAGGDSIEAGQPIVLTLSGLPYHSQVPRWTALSLVVAIVGAGIWGATRRTALLSSQDERKRLIARREKLFQDLLRLEQDRLNGRGDRSRSPGRREELLAALENVYRALDTDDDPHGPADRSGLAA